MADKKITDRDYLHLSAYIAAKEARMLTPALCERMLTAADAAECARLTEECDYPDMSGMNASEIEKTLRQHRDEVFSELAALSPSAALVDVFRCKYDYHNAKTLIKAEGANVDGLYLLSDSGRVAAQTFCDAYHEENYAELPAALAAAVAEARGIFARTANPQLADFALDRALYGEMAALSKEAGSPFLEGYVRLLVDAANLRSAVRCLRMGRGSEFLAQALIPGGNCDGASLLAGGGSGENLAALFASTELQKAAELGAEAARGGDLTAFEKACDDAALAYLDSARLVCFGAEPVAAYIALVENEIAALRIILTGRLSGVRAEAIRERLRELHA